MKSQSIAYLKGLLRRPETPLKEVAIALVALRSQPGVDIDILLSRLPDKNWKWIEDTSLLDSTLALLCIYRYKPELIDGECLAVLAKKLVKSEYAVGGPYKNISAEPAANAAIAQLFFELDHPLPNVVEYLKNCLDLNLSPIESLLLNWPNVILNDRSPMPDNTKIDPLVSAILKISTVSNTPGLTHINDYDARKNSVVLEIKDQLAHLPDPVRQLALKVWRAVADADKRQEISMLPRFFADSLSLPTKPVNDRLYVNLGVANFYAWMAYSIYDDFIDEEGVPNLLPIANIMHRKSVYSYQRLSPPAPLLKNTYDQVDLANSWELANTRAAIQGDTINITSIPNYRGGLVLAKRALGHVLGPLIIMETDAAITGQQKWFVRRGFYHYLIARQLSDDAHDWVKDLEKGQLNFVISHLLNLCNIKPGIYNIAELVDQLKSAFWRSGLKSICKITLNHIESSDQYFRQSLLFNDQPIMLSRILYPLADITNSSLKIHDDQKLFAWSYRQD